MKKLCMYASLFIFILSFSLSFGDKTAYACTPPDRILTTQEKIDAAKLIVHGKVYQQTKTEEIDANGIRHQYVTSYIMVKEYWKGKPWLPSVITSKQEIYAYPAGTCPTAAILTDDKQAHLYLFNSENPTQLLGFPYPSEISTNSITEYTALLGTSQYPLTEMPTIGTYKFNQDLKMGIQNDSVRFLQQYLNKKGFTISASGAGSPGNEVTYFGAKTRAALIRYQTANKEKLGIRQGTGYFGPATRALINSENLAI